MRSLGLVAVGLAAYTGQARSPDGYLPTVGPAPLRFQVPRAAPVFVLPPDKMLTTDSSPSSATDPPASSTPTPGAAETTLGPLNISAMLLNGPTNAPAFLEPKAPPLISPQMLLHFFTDSSFTNRQSVVTMPLSFSPALPPQYPSSSATYTSDPKP